MENEEIESHEDPSEEQKEEPKWVDEDDKNIKIDLNKRNHLKKLKTSLQENTITVEEYQKRIKSQYQTMANKSLEFYKWADKTEDEKKAESNKNELDKLLQTNKQIISKNIILKDSNILNISQLTPITKNNNQHNSIVTNILFHPLQSNIVLSTGLDKKLKLFKIIDTQNKSELVNTINTLDVPIYSCKFLDKNEVIISGRRKHYFTYDIEANKLQRFDGSFATSSNKISSLEKCFVGNDTYSFCDENGNIYLFDSLNKRFKFDIKLQCQINSICFDKNFVNFYVAGSTGEIYIFDIRQYRNCINKFYDYGNYCINCMEISNNSKFLATGSKNGYVNLYDLETIRSAESIEEADKIKPIKVFDNLTTSCDYIKFDLNNSFMTMSSRWKKNALRLVNLNNLKVYSNFPSFKEKIKYAICSDFSCDDSYFCIGNDEGKGLLYKINN